MTKLYLLGFIPIILAFDMTLYSCLEIFRWKPHLYGQHIPYQYHTMYPRVAASSPLANMNREPLICRKEVNKIMLYAQGTDSTDYVMIRFLTPSILPITPSSHCWRHYSLADAIFDGCGKKSLIFQRFQLDKCARYQ